MSSDRKKTPFPEKFRAFMTSRPVLLAGFSFLCSLALLVVILGAITPVRYTLSVGMVPTQTIVATKDVIDEVTTQKNRRLAADSVTPTYRYQEGVTEQVLQKLENIKQEFASVLQYAKSLDGDSAEQHYSKEEIAEASSMLTLVQLREFQLESLLNTSDEEFGELFAVLGDTLKNTMQTNITQGQETTAINSIMSIIGYRVNLDMLQNVAYPVLRAVIMPNMVIDQAATDEAKMAAMEAVDPVVFKQGQNILVRGEGRISETQLQLLSALGMLSTNKTDFNTYYGAILLVSVTLLLFSIILSVLSPEVYGSFRKLSILYLVMALTVVLTILAKLLHLPFLSPALFAPMVLTVSLGFLPAMAAHLALSVLASFVLSVGGQNATAQLVYLFPATLISGLYACFALRRNVQRGRVLAIGALSAAVSFLCVAGIGLTISSDMHSILQYALFSAGGCLLAALLCVGFQPIVEGLFNLPTQSRLMDLCNPTQPLLHRLLTEAPGTYHHSIIIANLAEASAEAIPGANPLLARVGGYYHDIGKLKRPLYFKENQIGTDNIHDETDPQVSAAIITAHVRDGLAMARQYRLPAEIQSIIYEHHGNSLVHYFFSKASEAAGTEPVDQSEYRYDSEPPRSKEAAIVMLCDTIEAAVRSLSSPTKEEIQFFILKLIRQKLDDGQLQNAPLTMQDIYTLSQSCATVLYGVFHERIEYPDVEKGKRKFRPEGKAVKKPVAAEQQSDAKDQGDGGHA